MNPEKLSDALGELDGKYIEETLDYRPKRRKTPWLRVASVAACFCLMIAIAVIAFLELEGKPSPLLPPEQSENTAGGGAVPPAGAPATKPPDIDDIPPNTPIFGFPIGSPPPSPGTTAESTTEEAPPPPVQTGESCGMRN